jgi:hypothetical protein
MVHESGLTNIEDEIKILICKIKKTRIEVLCLQVDKFNDLSNCQMVFTGLDKQVLNKLIGSVLPDKTNLHFFIT